ISRSTSLQSVPHDISIHQFFLMSSFPFALLLLLYILLFSFEWKPNLELWEQAALVFKSTNSEHVIKPTFLGVHMIINRKCESWNINLVVMESRHHLKLGESYYFSIKYSRSVHATLMDLVHKSVNETVRLNQYQTLSAAMKNTAIESVNKKWEGSKNATLQLVDMECSYITVDFFRKLSTALRIPSVLLHCGRCDSVQRILLMLRYEIVTASTLANGGLAMKSEEEKRFLRELLRQRGSAREEEEEKSKSEIRKGICCWKRNLGMDRLLHKARESVFVVSSVRGLDSCRNGDLTKLERYHNRRPWFYRDINNFGLGSSSMMLSSVCVRPNWFHHHYLFES
ncbi:hypothetical protein HID58_057611, partial [Brassica napus]